MAARSPEGRDSMEAGSRRALLGLGPGSNTTQAWRRPGGLGCRILPLRGFGTRSGPTSNLQQITASGHASSTCNKSTLIKFQPATKLTETVKSTVQPATNRAQPATNHPCRCQAGKQFDINLQQNISLYSLRIVNMQQNRLLNHCDYTQPATNSAQAN